MDRFLHSKYGLFVTALVFLLIVSIIMFFKFKEPRSICLSADEMKKITNEFKNRDFDSSNMTSSVVTGNTHYIAIQFKPNGDTNPDHICCALYDIKRGSLIKTAEYKGEKIEMKRASIIYHVEKDKFLVLYKDGRLFLYNAKSNSELELVTNTKIMKDMFYSAQRKNDTIVFLGRTYFSSTGGHPFDNYYAYVINVKEVIDGKYESAVEKYISENKMVTDMPVSIVFNSDGKAGLLYSKMVYILDNDYARVAGSKFAQQSKDIKGRKYRFGSVYLNPAELELDFLDKGKASKFKLSTDSFFDTSRIEFQKALYKANKQYNTALVRNAPVLLANGNMMFYIDCSLDELVNQADLSDRGYMLYGFNIVTGKKFTVFDNQLKGVDYCSNPSALFVVRSNVGSYMVMNSGKLVQVSSSAARCFYDNFEEGLVIEANEDGTVSISPYNANLSNL